jgi:hypothetical protein
MRATFVTAICLLCASLLLGQQSPPAAKAPFESQSSSTIRYYKVGSSDAVDTTNVEYRVVGDRFVLRQRVTTKRVIGDIGVEASTVVDAWPLGVDLRQKPLYSLTASGDDPRVVNNDLLVISRGLEEVDWWSVYNVEKGAHLFDTYVPLVQFSIARDTQVLRYVGFEVPPGDTSDSRLKAPNVVGVLTYASAQRVIREALITCDDPKQAQLLRSFADSTRTLTFSGGSLRLSISQNYPSPSRTVVLVVPIARDDLDFARSQLPAGLHVAAWKR